MIRFCLMTRDTNILLNLPDLDTNFSSWRFKNNVSTDICALWPSKSRLNVTWWRLIHDRCLLLWSLVKNLSHLMRCDLNGNTFFTVNKQKTGVMMMEKIKSWMNYNEGGEIGCDMTYGLSIWRHLEVLRSVPLDHQLIWLHFWLHWLLDLLGIWQYSSMPWVRTVWVSSTTKRESKS